MTGYTVHTGSNDKFRDGWDNIFGGTKKKSSKKKPAAKAKTGQKSKARKKKK